MTASPPTSSTQSRLYAYVGPADIKRDARQDRSCMHVTHSDLLLPWMQPFLPRGRRDGSVIATFVIDSAGRLWIADRHSEHVACAAGTPVQAAGEICLERSGSEVTVSEVSNQSTG
ncbi:MAG TPA: hypothetical protein VGE29_10490 [Prosthecobacter sp.]